MAKLNILAAIGAVSMIALPALAQASSSASTTSSRAEFIRPGDVSPDEFSRVLAEADRIRAFQAAQGTTSVPVTTYQAQAGSGASQGTQPQTYAQYIAARRQAQQQQQLAYQAQQQRYQAPQPVYQQPQTYRTQPQNTYPAPQPVYQQPAPRNYAQAPLPRNRVYQAPVNNPVIYAAMPNVTGAGPAVHTVIKGDTLYSLSKRYGISLANLKSANRLTSNLISVGQRLSLPNASRSMPVSYSMPIPAPARTYTAPTAAPTTPYRTTTRSTLVPTSYGNNMGSRLVKAVQPVPPSGVYAVLPNDTLYGISRFACVNPYDVARLNGITDTTALTPGQKLSMPAGHCLN